MNKYDKLKKILKNMRSVLVAYSGGQDSTLLLKAAVDCLGSGVLAVTADAPIYPREEILFAKNMARKLGVCHMIVKTGQMKDRRFNANTAQRCYLCKKKIFIKLREIAGRKGLAFVAEGTTLSDKQDFRPGQKAVRQLGIRSPLLEAGFYKEDVRRLSTKLRLPTRNKLNLACLATRIPCGMKISKALLARIERAEDILKKMRFSRVRVRDYGELCRIELLKKDNARLAANSGQVIKAFNRLGYKHVALDLEGYICGSMNKK